MELEPSRQKSQLTAQEVLCPETRLQGQVWGEKPGATDRRGRKKTPASNNILEASRRGGGKACVFHAIGGASCLLRGVAPNVERGGMKGQRRHLPATPSLRVVERLGNCWVTGCSRVVLLFAGTSKVREVTRCVRGAETDRACAVASGGQRRRSSS